MLGVQGWGCERRPMRPPDCAKQGVHLKGPPCAGPQQEHILWETEGHHQCPTLTDSEPSAPTPRPAPGHALTQLVKVGLGTTRARHRAHQPGLEKGAPFVHQHSLATGVILGMEGQSQPRAPGGGGPLPVPPSSPLWAKAWMLALHPCLSFPPTTGGDGCRKGVW